MAPTTVRMMQRNFRHATPARYAATVARTIVAVAATGRSHTIALPTHLAVGSMSNPLNSADIAATLITFKEAS